MNKKTDSTATPARGERLQKLLARGGIASRRHAEELIRDGRVRVNGRVVTELGTRADPRRDRVEVDGKRVVAERHVYLVVHKPRNVVSTMSDPEGRPTVKDLFAHVEARVYPVGRLDFGTSGVLLATNDGEFADALLHPRKSVPKTYVVKVSGTMKDSDLDVWRQGVVLDDGKTLPADVSLIRYEAGEGATPGRGKTWLEVTIREGRNQQIRRMGEATGFPIMRLARTSFAGVTSEGMRPGAVRSLVRAELVELKKAYGVPKSIPSEMESHESRARPRPPWRGKGEATTGESPRYGMGAPGRRSPETREDYGGRSGRGSSSGGRDEESAPPPPRGALGGGRFAPTRTTGTGGGIGAGQGSHRGRGRRGHGK